jgi:HK97 family phage major capsid protein
MPLDGSNIEQEFETLTGKVKGFADETKRFAESAQTELKNFGKLSEETKAAADKALKDLGETNARIAEMEQKLARRGAGNDAPELKTLGEHVIGNERVQALNSGTRGSASLRIETKDITSASGTVGSTAVAGNSLVAADRQAGVVMLPDRRLTIRDLITPGQTASSAIEYVVETGFTNNAAPVAETTLKPKSDVTFDLRNVPVRTLAHIVKTSRQILDDAPQLRSLIDGRLRYGLQYVEEAQLLFGAGTGANIRGIVPQATAYSAPFTVSGGTILDQLRLALLQASIAEYPATGVVLHPMDWARCELLKDSTGQYVIGRPQGTISPTVWGLPVVATPAMPADTFLTGAFRLGAQIFDRMAIEVLVSTENEDDFVKNMVTIRAEERLALAVYRPQAFITGDLGFIA